MVSFYFVKHGEGISKYIQELRDYLTTEKVLHGFFAPKFSTYNRLIYPIAATKFLTHFLTNRGACNVNHIHLPIPSLTVLFSKVFKESKKSVVQIWNLPHNGHEVRDLAQSFINSERVASYGLANLDLPVVVSSKHLRRVLAAAGAKRPYFIPAAIDTRRFSFAPDLETKSENDDPIVLYCGHLTKWKGVENLVKAMPHIIKERPSVRLRIAWTGHGSCFRQILQIIKKQETVDKVTIQNVIHENIELVFEKSSVGVLPLLSSVATASPPRTLLEMMAKGLPVVATNVGGVSEIVEHGKTGILVDSSPEDLAEGILALLADDSRRHRIAFAAREYVERYHDWSIVGPRYIKLYEEFS